MPASLAKASARRPLLRSRPRSPPADDLSVTAAGGPEECGGSSSACAAMLKGLVERSFGDLQFLVDEFANLEAAFAPVASNTGRERARATDPKLERLHFFTNHVRRTMDRLRAAQSGSDPLTKSQLTLLDHHITTSILPVKARLIQQLGRTSARANGVGKEAVRPDAGRNIGTVGSLSAGLQSMQVEESTDEGCTSSDTSISSNLAGLAHGGPLAGNCVIRSCSGGNKGERKVQHHQAWGASPSVASEDGFDVGLDVADEAPDDPDKGGQERACSILGHGNGSASDDADVVRRQEQQFRDQVDLLSQLEAEGVFAANESFSPQALPNSCLYPVSEEHLDADRPRDCLSEVFGTVNLDESAVKTELWDVKPPASWSMAATGWSSSVGVHGTHVRVSEATVAHGRREKEYSPGSSSLASTISPRPRSEPASLRTDVHGESSAVPDWERKRASTMSEVDRVAASAMDMMATSGPVRTTQASLPGVGDLANAGTVDGKGVMFVPSRPVKRRRSCSFPAALMQPREVHYQCGVCSKVYPTTVSGNPWWLLVRQQCPECHKLQIPRLDILNPTNNVESHIAFLTEACGEDGADGEGNCADFEGETSDDMSDDDDWDDEGESLLIASLAGEVGGHESGSLPEAIGESPPSLDSEQAAKLLVLMCHARGCPGAHRSPRLAEVCRSVKFLMLHIRDCSGTTPEGLPCPRSWCRPCKRLLAHLVRCPSPDTCRVCTPLHLPEPLRSLRDLNRSSLQQA